MDGCTFANAGLRCRLLKPLQDKVPLTLLHFEVLLDEKDCGAASFDPAAFCLITKFLARLKYNPNASSRFRSFLICLKKQRLLEFKPWSQGLALGQP